MSEYTDIMDSEQPQENEPVANTAATVCQQIYAELGKVFFGQDHVVSQVLAALLSGGHILLEGKPGLGKTHLVLALANTFGGEFGRIQFTPDLMPTDVTGFTLFDMKSQTFQMRKGPVFTNLLLGDEINRAPAKTQAALLEVMQEQQVTIDGESLRLDPPFMVLATQNPIEHEGTYPLPEAQLDRFLMKVVIDYPDQASEEQVVAQVTSAASAKGINANSVQRICSQQDILSAQNECAAVQAVPEVVRYAVNICRATRQSQGISLGAGTRGAISLIQVAKAYALMNSRNFVTPDDVKSASLPVLRHRVQLAPELAISGQDIDTTIAAIVNAVEAPRI
jgi:MoxR-like ATPase